MTLYDYVDLVCRPDHDSPPTFVIPEITLMSGTGEKPHPAVETLTARERRIIQGICDGFTCREIAARLGVSDASAREEIFTILDKLAVSDRVQLVVFAHKHRVVEPQES